MTRSAPSFSSALLSGDDETGYRAPWWLPGGHAQTIVPARLVPAPKIAYRRERWTAPDDDFIDLDWSQHPADDDAPLVIMFHGLEGDSSSHYSRHLMAALAARRWHGVIPHFRGCSGELNLAPRFYHSGDSNEIAWILERLHRLHCAPTGRTLLAVGISLGGNALLRFLGERRQDAGFVAAAASVSAPLDLAAGGAALGVGFNMVYTRMFLQTLKAKSLRKLSQHPGLYDRDAMLQSRDLYAFDNIVTAPLHGYRDTDDYWKRASSKPILPEITVPTLVLNARNDPFLPGRHLPAQAQAGRAVLLEQPAHGGHVGFLASRADWMPQRVLRFFDRQLGRTAPPGDR